MRRTSRHWTLVCGFGLCLSGCTQWSTYPPIETTQALSNRPAARPVPAVMAASITYAQQRYLTGEEAAINLPEGTPAEAYEAVLAKLGGGRPMLLPGEPTIHIQEVRTRGFDAQTDLIYQKSNGFYQLVTLTLRGNMMETYRVTSARPWQVRHLAAPGPHYVPPPAPVEQAQATSSSHSGGQSAAVLEVRPVQEWRTGP
jgi:hypothetical protein